RPGVPAVPPRRSSALTRRRRKSSPPWRLLLQDQLCIAGERLHPDLRGAAAVAGLDAGAGAELLALHLGARRAQVAAEGLAAEARSEEHTSELQSREKL